MKSGENIMAIVAVVVIFVAAWGAMSASPRGDLAQIITKAAAR